MAWQEEQGLDSVPPALAGLLQAVLTMPPPLQPWPMCAVPISHEHWPKGCASIPSTPQLWLRDAHTNTDGFLNVSSLWGISTSFSLADSHSQHPGARIWVFWSLYLMLEPFLTCGGIHDYLLI